MSEIALIMPVIPQSLFLVFEDGCDICLFRVIRGLSWFLQQFKGDREQPHNNISQLFYHPWMHLVKSQIYFNTNNLYFRISWKLNIQRKTNTTLILNKVSKFLCPFPLFRNKNIAFSFFFLKISNRIVNFDLISKGSFVNAGYSYSSSRSGWYP